MKKIFKRIIALLMVFVISLSVLLVPASAASEGKKESITFWKYLNLDFLKENLSDWWKNLVGESDPKDAYNDYVQTLPATGIGSDGGFYWFPTSADVSNLMVSFPYAVSTGHNYSASDLPVSFNGWTYSWDSSRVFNMTFSGPAVDTGFGWSNNIRIAPRVIFTFTAPFSGSYRLISSSIGQCACRKSSDDTVDSATGSYPAASSSSAYSSGSSFDVEATLWLEYRGNVSYLTASFDLPVFEVFPNTAFTQNYTDNTRAGKFSGDYFYEGDNGTQIVADEVTLFNETTKNVYNPATKETVPVKEWYYDYSDRSYHYTTDTGNKGIVKYGDENASVTMQDSNGNTITYNYYYYAKSGGSDSGGGSSSSSSCTDTPTESIWTKLGKLLGSVTDAFLSILKGFIGKILDFLIDLCDMIGDKLDKVVSTILGIFEKIPALFAGFTGFLSATFPFLPEEFWDILYLGAALAALLLIIKVIRNN